LPPTHPGQRPPVQNLSKPLFGSFGGFGVAGGLATLTHEPPGVCDRVVIWLSHGPSPLRARERPARSSVECEPATSARSVWAEVVPGGWVWWLGAESLAGTNERARSELFEPLMREKHWLANGIQRHGLCEERTVYP